MRLKSKLHLLSLACAKAALSLTQQDTCHGAVEVAKSSISENSSGIEAGGSVTSVTQGQTSVVSTASCINTRPVCLLVMTMLLVLLFIHRYPLRLRLCQCWLTAPSLPDLPALCVALGVQIGCDCRCDHQRHEQAACKQLGQGGRT